MKTFFVIIIVSSLGLGCSTPSTKPNVEPETRRVLQRSQLTFDGDLEATNATKMMAPSADVFLGQHRRRRNWQRIKFLAEEGKKVKKGDRVLKFEFESAAALVDIKNEIKQIKAEAEKAKLAQLEELRDLKSSQGQLELTVKSAFLDTQRQGVVSKRAQRLYEFDHKIAQFDSLAVRKRIRAHEQSMASSARWYDERLKAAEGVLKKYQTYEKRYVLKAPHDGYVRHGKHPWRRRRIKQGDRVPAGLAAVSIAQDVQLTARFYVPEALASRIKEGHAVVVTTLAGDKRWDTTIRAMEDIPQEIGFLRKDEELSNAREKAYVAVADLKGDARGVAAGTEIKVSVPGLEQNPL